MTRQIRKNYVDHQLLYESSTKLYKTPYTLAERQTMSTSVYCSLFLLFIAVGLSFLRVKYESFVADYTIGSSDARRCGLTQYGTDEPPCPFGQTCTNGWCASSTPPSLPPTTGLPVYP